MRRYTKFRTAWLLLFVLLHFATATAQFSSTSSRQLPFNFFLDWIASILRPPGSATSNATAAVTLPPTTTTASPTTSTPIIPQRECPDCICGTINTIRRIVGGQETEVHQYPWMALLLSNGFFYCGASLINDLYVVTAAHCVSGFYKPAITVRLLEHNRNSSNMNIIDRRAVWIEKHESYNRRTYDNDIALIRLAEPVKFNDLLRPVCLPDPDKSFAGEMAVVTGWGALSEGGSVSNTLQEVFVPVLSQDDCRKSNYGATRITDNMLCAGYDEGGKDSCQGDSGGPLHVVVESIKEHQLAGVVSWGEGCARPRSPGVYTRVSRYRDWIKERTRDACYCKSQSTVQKYCEQKFY